MKQLLSITFLALIYCTSVYSQEKMDVIYMQDGSVINAFIIKEDSASMRVALLTKDTLNIAYKFINKIYEDSRSTAYVKELIKRNRPTEASRFLKPKGWLISLNQSTIIGNASFERSPFRPVSLGVGMSLRYWYARRLSTEFGANIENSISGNFIVFNENRIHFSKNISSPFLFVNGGYSVELSTRGPSFNEFISGYKYSGFRGLMLGAGLGYRIKISNYTLMNLGVGYRYLDLIATERWDGYEVKTLAQIQRIKLNVSLSF